MQLFKASIHALGVERLSSWHHLGCGAAAGLVSLLVSYPFDVVRKRMMVQQMLRHKYHYAGFVDAVRQIEEKEGLFSLYRGMVAGRIKTPIASAVTFALYEFASQGFRERQWVELNW